MKRIPLLVALILAALTLGCQRRVVGHFGDGAFYHARGHYRIRYPGADASLLPESWRLTNYRLDHEGRPSASDPMQSGVDVFPVSWLTGQTRHGRFSFSVPKVDLRYRDEAEGEIWVRTMVLPHAWRETSVASILHAAVQRLPTSASAAVPLDPLGRRFPPDRVELVGFGQARVDGRPAHWVELDATRGSTTQRITLVAMRPGRHRYQWRRRFRFPMLLVFGCASPPERHELVRRDFETLVRRVDIGR